MGIIQQIASKNYIVLNKELAKKIGLEEAIILGELCSEYDYWEKNNQLDNGYFYSTIENIEKHTTINKYKQGKAFANLKKKGLISIIIKGLPAKRYVKINEEPIVNLFDSQLFKNYTTSSLKTNQLEVQFLDPNNNNINNNNYKYKQINNSVKISSCPFGKEKADSSCFKCFYKNGKCPIFTNDGTKETVDEETKELIDSIFKKEK